MPSSNHTCYPGSNSRLDAVTEGVVYEAAESPDTQQLHRPNDSEDDAECISQDGCNCQSQIQNKGNEIQKVELCDMSISRDQSNAVVENPASRSVAEQPPVMQTLTDLENGLIGWDGERDPENPLKFTSARKWLITSILSAIGFMTPFASSIIAPAISFIQKDFGVNDLTKSALPVSIFLLGYAVGPLFLSPLSEIYGRYIIITVASTFFCVWLIGCALAPSLNTLILFRFLCGVGGSASQTIGGATIADLFPVHERGRALGIWSLGPILGPSCAPVIGGFVAESIGWRWANWITLIPTCLIVVLMAIFNCETNHRVLIERKTARTRQQLGRPELQSCFANPNIPRLSKEDIILGGLIRPLRLLFGSAIVFGISLYIAFAYGCLYLLFNTIPIVFQDHYGWSIGITGIVYLALLIGYIIGLVIFLTMSDKTIVRMTEANGGVYEPEMRLPVCIYFACLLPIAFFLYGWSSEKGSHWIVPVLGLVVFGIGFECIWLPTQAFIVDAYPQCAASALAAFSVMRSVVAAFLPLAGPQMYHALGLGWGNTVLGLIALALVPVPLVIYKFGKTIRKHERWKL
ncbi:major facilitator superfamily domain-containing protein [Penicillium samsonianum]|uniref:major facilitator superfamily domain-containing protein n=1 Tax=Penicillium samsonianum TaxID=1882272 RepID=UPI002546DBE5|nr:major facilitator superfamily domain-containing protein [Penicillium samsonianum]KAJ6148920.1 major facilitator superfamily domain-containing protein [Penicillium samsonianum]